MSEPEVGSDTEPILIKTPEQRATEYVEKGAIRQLYTKTSQGVGINTETNMPRRFQGIFVLSATASVEKPKLGAKVSPAAKKRA